MTQIIYWVECDKCGNLRRMHTSDNEAQIAANNHNDRVHGGKREAYPLHK